MMPPTRLRLPSYRGNRRRSRLGSSKYKSVGRSLRTRLPPKEGLPDHGKPAAVLVTVKDKSPRDGVCGPPSLTSHCALAATGDG